MFNLKTDLWFGDEESLREALEVEQRILAMLPAQGKSFTTGPAAGPMSGTGPAGEKLPRLYSRNGNVGVVSIRGPLINTENIFTEIFGISTYPAIREAMVFGAADAKVSELLLDIESPGGQVSGTNDTAKLVKEVDKVKPVTAFSDSLVASAAYWIASGARKLHVGETAIVGSIGVIATIQSVHEALKKEGVEVRVIRAGKNKMPGHPAEPISDKAVAKVQAHADALYAIFTDTVSANRSQLKPGKVDSWANGNEFLGQDAVDAGLADSVSSFDKVFAGLVENVDSAKNLNNNANTRTRGMKMPRAALDPKIVAAIEAGAPLTPEQEAQVKAATAADEAPAPTAPAAAAAEATDAAATSAPAAAAAAPEADAKPAADAAPAADAEKPDVVAYLEKANKELQDDKTELTVQLKAANDKLAEIEATQKSLCEIAGRSISNMNIALGGSAVAAETLTARELVAKHAALSEQYKKAFPVGGVAAVAPADDKKADTTAAPASDRSRVRLRMVKLDGGK